MIISRLKIPAPAWRRGRPKVRPLAATPPTPTLNLVAATYESGASVTLTFDRAIDVSAIDAQSIVVNDGDDQHLVFDGNGGPVTLVSPTTVRLELSFTGGSGGTGIVLSAPAGNGIVAADDGAAWAGVTELALPFG